MAEHGSARSAAAALVTAALAWCAEAPADPPSHALWRVEGATNQIFLLGSVHFLRQSDYPLPEAFAEAYAEAEALYMELDLDDLDPLAAAALMTRRGRLAEGRTLRSVLGEAYAGAAEHAASLGIQLDRLDALEPWYAAMTVLQLKLIELGFDPSQGIESHFANRAAQDGKPILGLETLEEQIDVLDSLPDEVQCEFLLMSLQEAANLDEQLALLLSAWRDGHIDRLAAELQRSFEPFPELYERMIVARNTRWTEAILELLDQPRDYLIVVGALHLAGEDSVIELLARRGIRTRQL